MNRTDMFLLRFAASVAVVCIGVMACVAIVAYVVGGRAPSPSPGVPHAPRADSEAAPARPLETGASGSQSTGRADSDLEHPVWSAVVEGGGAASERPAPASTVTTQALVTATVVIDPVPATPVSTSPAVVTQGAKSDIWGLIAASPWPQYLWGTVACLVERESRGQAWQVSPGGDVGLMQIGPANFAFLAERGITRAMLFDGATNLAAGWILYVWWQGVNGDGWTPWASTRGGCA